MKAWVQLVSERTSRLPPSRLPSRKHALFSEIAYENLVDDYLYRLLRYENNLEKGQALIRKILRIIENNP